ncbi:MAG: hypothetical protein AAGI46_10960 [Planctomycetota bacterium]
MAKHATKLAALGLLAAGGIGLFVTAEAQERSLRSARPMVPTVTVLDPYAGGRVVVPVETRRSNAIPSRPGLNPGGTPGGASSSPSPNAPDAGMEEDDEVVPDITGSLPDFTRPPLSPFRRPPLGPFRP